MQDYNYFHSNCFEITLELSCCKFPYARELEKYWNDNKNALLAFIRKVGKTRIYTVNLGKRNTLTFGKTFAQFVVKDVSSMSSMLGLLRNA